MNKLILFVQLLLINGIRCASFSSPEECLQILNCRENINCRASCYNVPAPDHNSVIKTADCQNGCLAKYPNNLSTDWANLNQCYIDCVQNNYFNYPAEYIAYTSNNNNNNNNNSGNNNNANSTNNNNNNNNNTVNPNNNGNNSANNGIVDSNDNLNVIVESYAPAISCRQTFITIVIMFITLLALN